MLFSYLTLIYLNYSENKNIIINLAKTEQINIVKFYKQRIDEWLNLKKASVELAAKSISQLDLNDTQKIHKILDNTALIGDFESVYVSFGDDKFIINTNEIPPSTYKATNRQWYKDAIKFNHSIITSPYEDAFIKDQIRFSVASSLDGKSGVISADIVLNTIEDEIENINKSIKGFAFLITKNNELVAGANKIDKCKECMMILNDINFTKTIKNQNLLFYEPLSNAKWIFGVKINENEILKELNNKFKTNIAFGFIFALIGISGFWLLNLFRKKAKKSEQIMLNHSKIAAMGEMLVATTHQLKQPLSAMRLNIDMMQNHIENQNLIQANQKLEKTKEIINFMQTTIDGFKNFYRPENEFVKADLAKIINDVFFIIKPVMQLNNIELVLNYDINKKFEILTQPNYVKQILINLLSNAKDAIQTADKNAKISVNIDDDRDKIYISVIDNGTGINPKISLFKEAQTTKTTGSGNGLYICKLLAHRLNGDIYLKNRINPTIFEFYLNKDEK